MKKTIVISAVNIRKGGTLTILKDCLQYLSGISNEYRIVALVHKKELSFFNGIEYIELPWAMKNWVFRLYCEYVTMRGISKKIGEIDVWLSLHDTTPNVRANRQAVYCQTSFPFYKWRLQDFRFDYKIPLFSMFTRYAYRINIHKNQYLIVQQEWLRNGFGKMFHIDSKKMIVFPPQQPPETPVSSAFPKYCHSFFYASTADCHKNFELICRAADLLEREIGTNKFSVTITIAGNENKYAAWLYKKWQHVPSLTFAGFMNKEQLTAHYESSDCFIFPSKIETWGLPISEFMQTGKPMLLADLPYAHETAAGSTCTAFFNPNNAEALKNLMKKCIEKDISIFHRIEKKEIVPPTVKSWHDLFTILAK
jgi:glycosyltransferase involved in cell wall biosynthesis